MQTAALLVRGALMFESWLRRWLGNAVNDFPVSDAFVYGVHRHSLVPPERFEDHLRACHEMIRDQAGSRAAYFGRDLFAPQRRLSHQEMAHHFNQDLIAAAYATQEISIDPRAMCAALAERLAAEPHIELARGSFVAAVEKDGKYLRVLSRSAKQAVSPDSCDVACPGARERFHHVVNAAWDGRLSLDHQIGIEPPGRWSYRMKYFLRLDGALTAPSVTFVLGPFGDIAQFGDSAYLSWYPAGLRYWSFERAPPAWPTEPEGKEADLLAGAICAGLAELLPNLKCAAQANAKRSVKGGVIYALGDRDIDDPNSALHNRSIGVGITSRSNYHTINSGKLSIIPLFARELADRILPQKALNV